MKITETNFPGLFTFQRNVHRDQRGLFEKLFGEEAFRPVLKSHTIKQVNHSKTFRKGAFRGLHFQTGPHSEIKIVQAIKGKVFDIGLDLRKESPTFMKTFTIILDGDLGNGVILPAGIAHGFQVLEDDSQLIYLHTENYIPESESGVNITDPMIKIELPLPVTDINNRDSSYPFIDQKFKGFI